MSDRLDEIRAQPNDPIRVIKASLANGEYRNREDFGDDSIGSAEGAIAYLLDALATAQQERDDVKRWLDDAGRAYAPCHEHQPDMWEGDGTCVICEGDKLAAQLRVAHEALEKSAKFIEYARYELEDGTAQIGDQFPRKGDADKMLAQIGAALASSDPRTGTGATKEQP